MNDKNKDKEGFGPASQVPHGWSGPSPFPRPHHPYGPPQPEPEVAIKVVDNGWIVTAPGEDDTYIPDDQVHVFQFDQKPEMLALVDKVTPRPKGEEKS